MAYENDNLIDCTRFEERLTDYIDKSLAMPMIKLMAEHAMGCPLCHSLLNDVKGTMAVCRDIAEPRLPVTRLEAKILSRTMPNANLACAEFEEYLTDYLDGFLPAKVFHRWERHAVLCADCTDLPGAVVRSLAALIAYKSDELPLSAGLHRRILEQTIGTARVVAAKQKVADKFGEWARGLRFPISVPQLAPVAMMMAFAFLVFSQTVSADGSLAGIYTQGVELATQTYKQGEIAFGAAPAEQQQTTEPVTGTTYVDEKK
ncbi:MAG: hypothetical protein LC730_06180 [Acidobacteria bacterium]|nr:hypothetical protein [Acidobacteriota bacterium]MCA1609028.1 hypothetical protein [Acidobacteriota bacterium]